MRKQNKKHLSVTEHGEVLSELQPLSHEQEHQTALGRVSFLNKSEVHLLIQGFVIMTAEALFIF